MLHCTSLFMDNRCFPVHPDSGEPVIAGPIGRHDPGRMRAGIAALSDHSRSLRFFNGGQAMTEYVIERLCDAELALAVLDDWQGKGRARLLLKGVMADARRAGITHLTAETFAENRATRQLLRSLGGLSVHRDGPVVSYRFDIETAAQKPEGLTQTAAGEAIRAGVKQTAPAQALGPPVRVRRCV
jgi:GNAT superfamily N-acetyltransferase